MEIASNEITGLLLRPFCAVVSGQHSILWRIARNCCSVGYFGDSFRAGLLLFFFAGMMDGRKTCNNVKIRRDDCLYGKNARLTMIEVKKKARYYVK
jgi:hypothetical protein